MGIALVQSTYERNVVTPLTISGVGAGNCLVLFNSAVNYVTGIVDSTGDMWTHYSPADSTAAPSGPWVSLIWYAQNVSGGNHVLTITLNQFTGTDLTVAEFSGVDTTSPIYGGAAVNNAGFNTATGPVLTVVASGDAGITCAIPNGASGAISPWLDVGPTGMLGIQDVGYLVTSSTSPIQATFVATNAEASGAMLKAAGSAPSNTATLFLAFD